MPSQRLTETQAQRVIFDSLSLFWNFAHRPNHPDFLDERIVWRDVLAVEHVTKTLVRSLTILAVRKLDPDRFRPRLNTALFHAHIDANSGPTGETVKKYRDFLIARVRVFVGGA